MCMTVVVVLSVIAEMSSMFCGWISSFSCSLICCLYNLVIRFSTLGWLESKCGKVLVLLWKCLSFESAWFDVGKSFIYRPEKRWLGDKDGTNTPSLLCFRAPVCQQASTWEVPNEQNQPSVIVGENMDGLLERLDTEQSLSNCLWSAKLRLSEGVISASWTTVIYSMSCSLVFHLMSL